MNFFDEHPIVAERGHLAPAKDEAFGDLAGMRDARPPPPAEALIITK